MPRCLLRSLRPGGRSAAPAPHWAPGSDSGLVVVPSPDGSRRFAARGSESSQGEGGAAAAARAAIAVRSPSGSGGAGSGPPAGEPAASPARPPQRAASAPKTGRAGLPSSEAPVPPQAAAPAPQAPHSWGAMASRLLHRLRHTLTGEGGQEGLAGCSPETEDFPESSELEDDTEGLSTRLSGTLSFTSNDEDGQTEEEEDAPVARPEAGGALEPGTPGDATESGEPPAERRGSNMLTRQLQELWRKSRSSLVPQRLLFEVTSTSVVSERNSKYVLYTVFLIQTGQFDRAPAMIARRYSDFERLYRRLRRHFGSDLAGLSFPRKRLRRNFAAETIAKRSRAFEQLLGRLHAVPEIRRSEEYLQFFFLRDLRGAQQLTGRGRYQEALLAWTNARWLQEKLGACCSGHFLLTLAGLAVCQQELARFGEAHAACERALQLLEAQDRHPLLLPFLHAHLHLAQRLGKDRRPAEAWLRGLEEAGGAGQQPPSLKEHLLQQPLP